jgi:hypothetical protein
MANITTAEVNEMLATIIAAEALGRLRSNTVLAQLVARDWDTEVATYGQTVQIPFRGSLSVNDKAREHGLHRAGAFEHQGRRDPEQAQGSQLHR